MANEWEVVSQTSAEQPKSESSATTPAAGGGDEWAVKGTAKAEKPMAEKIFGPGVGQDATATQRVVATGEAAAGAAIGGEAIRRIATKMALRHTAAAMTGIGATPLVQGTLLAADAYELAKLTAVGGAVGSMVEQAAEKMGAGRGTQVALGSVLPGVGPTVARAGMGALEAAGPTLGKMAAGASYMIPKFGGAARHIAYGLKGAGQEQLRKEATEAARSEVLRGVSPEAGATAGTALERGVEEQTGRFRTALELKKARAAEATKRSEQAAAEAETAAAQAKSGIGAEMKPHEVGTKIQESVTKEQEKLLSERASGYKQRFNAALESARTKEKAGQHFGASEEGDKLKEALNQKIRGTGEPTSDYTQDQKAQFSKLKEQIFGRKGAVDPITGEKLPDIKPASAKQLDTLVRRLGDAAYGKEAEGAKAIDSQVAKDTRDLILKGADGKGGIYAWEPKFAEAKGFYREMSDKLGPWSTKRGQAVTSKEDFQGVLAQRPTMEAEKVPGQYFKTQRGFSDLVQQTGGDPKKAVQLGEQHALRELEGTNATQAQKWLDKQSWLDNPQAKPIRDKVETYIVDQQQKEGRAGAMAQKAKDTKPKTFLEDVDAKVASHRESLEKKFGVGSAVDNRMEDVIGGKMTSKDVQEFKNVMRSSPEAIKALPDVALQYIVKGNTKETINQRASQVLHNLQRAGMISEKQAADILTSSNKVAGVVEGPIKNRKQLDTWAEHFTKRLYGAASRTVSDFGTGQVQNIMGGSKE